jgi:hypothetical protein
MTTCSTEVSHSTVGATELLDGYSCPGGVPQPGAETIYEFTPQAPGLVTVSLNGATADLDLYVLEGACSPDVCLASGNDTSTTDETVTFDAAVGILYYIVVESTGGESGFVLDFEPNTQGCPEDCDDSVDKDEDGDTDCLDPDCAADPVCAT